MFNLYKFTGVIGLLLICTAMVVKDRKTRNILAFFGGIGLLIYSIYLKDLIFVILQSVYIIVVSVDFIKEKIKI